MPKVLVASQGRVIEALVDAEGIMVPSTPVIAIVPHHGVTPTIWHVAAMLTAPDASIGLHREAGGTGLGRGGCRVTARFLASLPLPGDDASWDLAADAAHRATAASLRGDGLAWTSELEQIAGAWAAAVDPGVDDDVDEWWRERRPRWRGARTLSG